MKSFLVGTKKVVQNFAYRWRCTLNYQKEALKYRDNQLQIILFCRKHLQVNDFAKHYHSSMCAPFIARATTFSYASSECYYEIEKFLFHLARKSF